MALIIATELEPVSGIVLIASPFLITESARGLYPVILLSGQILGFYPNMSTVLFITFLVPLNGVGMQRFVI